MSGRQFLVVVIITFITVVVWVILDILHGRSTVTIPPQTQELIKPVSPNFDIGVLEN